MSKPQIIEEDSTIVEGLPGRLPALVGGLMFFISGALLARLRGALHTDINTISFDDFTTWGPLLLIMLVVAIPLLHQLAHFVALRASGAAAQWSRRLIYPQVRPVTPLARPQAIWFFAAPLVLSGVLVLMVVVRSLSGFVVLMTAVNLALSVNDIWKIIGLLRFPATTRFEIKRDYCQALNTGRAARG